MTEPASSGHRSSSQATSSMLDIEALSSCTLPQLIETLRQACALKAPNPCELVLHNVSAPLDLSESDAVAHLRDQFIINIKRRPVRGESVKLATETINFLRKIILQADYDNLMDLLKILRQNERVISATFPREVLMRNLVLMVCKLARDEHFRVGTGKDDIAMPIKGLQKLWEVESSCPPLSGKSMKEVKKRLMLTVKELQTEVDVSRDSIISQGIELLNAGDVIIVHSLAKSPILMALLKAAKNVQKFRVFSVQDDDSDDKNCTSFATQIRLSDVSQKMAEATKVFLVAAAVLPDGSCFVPAGGFSICLAAHYHSVPVHILTSFYKICPFFPPLERLSLRQEALQLPTSLAKKFAGRVQILQPALEHIPHKFISLIITNAAAISPDHTFRLISDYYNPDDYS